MSDMKKKVPTVWFHWYKLQKEEKVSCAVGIQDSDFMTRWEQGRVFRGLVTFYLFMVTLCLHCSAQALSSQAGPALHRSVRASHCDGFSCCTSSRYMGFSSCGLRLSKCGARTSLIHSMWNLPGPGMKSMSTTLAGGSLSTAWPEIPGHVCFGSGCWLHKSFQFVKNSSRYTLMINMHFNICILYQ